jgi:hypothetical protein
MNRQTTRLVLCITWCLVAGCTSSYSLDLCNETGEPITLISSIPDARIDIAPAASARIDAPPSYNRPYNGIYMQRGNGQRLYIYVASDHHVRLAARLERDLLVLVPPGSP